MRLLVVIPHYFRRRVAGEPRHGSQGGDSTRRIRALTACLHSLHQHWGLRQCVMQIAERRTRPANTSGRSELHVVLCTTGDEHVLSELPVDRALYQHFSTDVAPMHLGFQCRAVLRDRWGNYDYYCYLEDDLILHDPWFLAKLQWFNSSVGQQNLLLPNRFERGPGPLAHKAYVDGDLALHVTARFQNIEEAPQFDATVMGQRLLFRRPLNPHSGCYFLNHEQMREWIQRADFLDYDSSFIGPLESAATLGIMRTFRIYKPAIEQASFLEIEHFGDQFIRLLRPATSP